jgi:hypothetical protein
LGAIVDSIHGDAARYATDCRATPINVPEFYQQAADAERGAALLDRLAISETISKPPCPAKH